MSSAPDRTTFEVADELKGGESIFLDRFLWMGVRASAGAVENGL